MDTATFLIFLVRIIIMVSASGYLGGREEVENFIKPMRNPIESPLPNRTTPNSVISTTPNDMSNWARLTSLWPLLYGTSCCSIEFASLIGSRFDFDRYGLVPRSSPRQADLIITAGTVTMKMAPSLVRLYEQMPELRYVIAMGAYVRGQVVSWSSAGASILLVLSKEGVLAWLWHDRGRIGGCNVPSVYQGSIPREIYIHGPQVIKAYFNDPKAIESTIDENGWLHTDNVGYMDNDKEVFIVDRLEELIKYKGFQVPLVELGAILVKHPSITNVEVTEDREMESHLKMD
eukprot:Gb_14100 [translate_table: standard]